MFNFLDEKTLSQLRNTLSRVEEQLDCREWQKIVLFSLGWYMTRPSASFQKRQVELQPL